MYGNPDRAGLVGDCTGNGLPDPPGRVGGKFEAFAVIKFLHGLDQTEVSFLDQVKEKHTASDVPLGNGNHQAKICLGEFLLGRLVAGFKTLGDLDFLFCGQKRHLADFL